MKVEVITIGDELLIGQVVDTNSAWIGSKLNENGIHLSKITSIGDSKKQIYKALDDAFASADAILMTGGLGPTKDDITKKTLAEYFQCGFKTDRSAGAGTVHRAARLRKSTAHFMTVEPIVYLGIRPIDYPQMRVS